jgi:hypothetical protein
VLVGIAIMPFSPDQIALLRALSATWPPAMQFRFAEAEIENLSNHPLEHEVVALRDGAPASLPFFPPGGEIAWFTIAPDAERLRAAVEDLRAWILPSFGWEDSRGWLVLPGQPTGQIGCLLLAMSPAGYCRWGSAAAQLNVILHKLRQKRRLEEARPAVVVARVPSLLELREQFVVAMLSGDRASAETAVQTIDRYQLDAADNTLFMRFRCWAHFRDDRAIVEARDLARLVHLRTPRQVRCGVLAAFHAVYLAPPEEAGDLDAALRVYSDQVHGRMAGMIAHAEAEDGVAVERLLAYRAVHQSDAQQGAVLRTRCRDPIAAAVLERLPQPGAGEAESAEAAFLAARSRRDWAVVQELGLRLLDESPECAPILRRSLEFRPHAELLMRLDAVSPAAVGQRPQSWCEWLRDITSDGIDLQTFLETRGRPDLERLSPEEILGLQEGLEEVLSHPGATSEASPRQRLQAGLPELMVDYVSEPEFPRPQLRDVYLGLFRLWTALKQGSAFLPDAHVLLELSQGVLQNDRAAEAEIGEHLQAWWVARPVKALLPFVLGAVELLDQFGSDRRCENLWICAADFVHRNLASLTVGERSLWRAMGARIGLDGATLDEYVPLPPPEEAAADPLREAGLGRIAIVSLRERQAQQAAEMIRSRCAAEVLIVSGTVADAATATAAAADVVLFVWSAATHAVFRAFDGMERSRLAYVCGTGAASIVRALERWLARSGSGEETS